MTVPNVISSSEVPPTSLRRLVRHLVVSVRSLPDSTREIILVYDKEHWVRLYWNNVAGSWKISRHASGSWMDIKASSTDDLLAFINNAGEKFLNVYAVQHRTSAGANVYTASAKS